MNKRYDITIIAPNGQFTWWHPDAELQRVRLIALLMMRPSLSFTSGTDGSIMLKTSKEWPLEHGPVDL